MKVMLFVTEEELERLGFAISCDPGAVPARIERAACDLHLQLTNPVTTLVTRLDLNNLEVVVVA